MGQVTEATKRKLRKRDGGCVSRGIVPGSCWGHLDAGHIIGRGMGGTPQGHIHDQVQWLILQCRGHNRAIETHDDARRAAELAGQHISRNATALIPERACVQYPDGLLYWLNADGTKERTADDWSDAPKTTHAGEGVHPVWLPEAATS